MKKQAINIALVIIIILFGWLYYQKQKEKQYDQYMSQRDMIYAEAKEDNKKTQMAYDVKIAQLNDSITILLGMIETNETQIKTLKLKRNEKNNNIGKFSTIDLSKFISDFYKDSVK